MVQLEKHLATTWIIMLNINCLNAPIKNKNFKIALKKEDLTNSSINK
jgi:hypothetical protein